MSAETPWHAFYQGDLQSLHALVAAPAAFLLLLLARPFRASDPQARFVVRWAVAFALETILDPIATGPLSRTLPDGAKQAVMVLFVLLGDFRVWWLVLALALGPERRARASLLGAVPTCAVPIFAYLCLVRLRVLWPELPGQGLWLLHETSFLALALAVRGPLLRRLAPGAGAAERRLARALLAYAAVYYALWAGADLLILAGVDAGWALRIVPNQLYYAFTVPFVYFRAFGLRRAGGLRPG